MSLSHPSPLCNVNASPSINGVNVTAASTVTIALADTAGVKQWTLSCLNTDDLLVASTITAGLTINTVAKTATFTAPAVGSALILQSVVNNGKDANGAVDPTLTTTFGIYVLTTSGYRVAAFDEKTEGSSAFGWVTKLNAVVRNNLVAGATAGNGILFASGAYSVKPDPDGSIAVTASGVKVGVLASDAQHGTRGGGSTHAQVTGSTNGFMRAADKTIFDAATSAATASALAKRDASGNCSFAAVTCSGIANSGNATHAGTLGVTGTATLATVSCTQVTLKTAVVETRVQSTTPYGLSTQWAMDGAGSLTQVGTTQDSYLFIPLDIPNGVKLTSVSVHVQAAFGHSAFPAGKPTIGLDGYRATGFVVDPLVAPVADASPSLIGYQIGHAITISGLNLDIDRSVYNYRLFLTGEYGANSLAGLTVLGATATWTRPVGSKIGQD
jgi:hypothetical protein